MTKRNKTVSEKETYSLINPSDVITVALDMGVEHTGVSIWHSEFSRPYIFQVENPEPLVSFKPVAMAQELLTAVSTCIVAALGESFKDYQVLFCIEDYAFGRGYFNVLQPEIIGAMKAILHSEEWPHPTVGMVFMPLGTVKKQVAGSGKASKTDVKRAVKEAGYDCKSSHEADSVAVYLTYEKLWQGVDESVIRRSMILHKEFLEQ